MELTFIGAAHEVTGSCFLLNTNGKNILIDCGMEQGRDIFENQELSVSPSMIDYVLLTHAHIDHSGKIPLLYAHGFRGSIYATNATTKLCDIMLRDSAHIQEFEAEWRNRKAKRAGREPYVPFYTMDDAIGSIKLFVPCGYDKDVNVFDGFSIRFIDAGHLLGSSSIEVTVTEGENTEKIVFSGDIGNVNKPILRDPQYLTRADYVIMESTYGNRSHGEAPDYVKELSEIIQRTFDRGGNVVIPSFAVGRTQEMLYFLRKIKEDNLVKGHDNFTVVVDSPLAVEATSVFSEDGMDCFDQETLELIKKGVNPIVFQGLKVSVTSDESKMINYDKSCKVIISASGMCEAGRIRHHLKHNLWRKESTILFVGYQSENTIGRQLLDGASSVKLFGETIEVRAEITQLNSISGHADDKGLIKWVSNFSPKPKRVFVVHGDENAVDEFTARLNDECKITATAPYSGDKWDLVSGEQIEEGSRKRVERKNSDNSSRAESPNYMRLIAAAKRLSVVVEHNRGGTNKDLAKFTDQINSLCDKWDR